MKNYVAPGDMITCTAPTGGVASGDVVVIGSIFGIAAGDAIAGAQFELKTTGVFELPKHSATASADWSAGDAVYWDAGDGECNKSTSGNTKIGVAVADAASAATTGLVRLNGSF